MIRKGVGYLYRSQGQSKAKEIKKAGYEIGNISMKDLSNIIRDFDKFFYKSYERRRPKHEPTDSYFYPSIKLAKCMIRSDALNSHVCLVRTKITGTKQIPISHIFSTDKSGSKEFPVDEMF